MRPGMTPACAGKTGDSAYIVVAGQGMTPACADKAEVNVENEDDKEAQKRPKSAI